MISTASTAAAGTARGGRGIRCITAIPAIAIATPTVSRCSCRAPVPEVRFTTNTAVSPARSAAAGTLAASYPG
ncbi:hypothetical protein GCM10011491_44730 [Brucella endophytica]|uniref:Uncharacterized protein n=1 Tax=Brucella endophytica TaxID=1963359 RepID=A0A916WMD4_9HYPH|nr:hypothetical protein GCM10011491_44730 [Brucella endophytica]